MSTTIHQALLTYASLVTDGEFDLYRAFLDQAVSLEKPNRNHLLLSIPRPKISYGPLLALSALLSSLPGQWSVLKLQQAYTAAWKKLPEEAKSGQAPPLATQLLDQVLQQCKNSYSSLVNLLHGLSTSAAIIDPETGNSIPHDRLARSIRRFSLPLPCYLEQKKPVVAISLPNGPLLALTVLATTAYYTSAPLAHGSGVGAEQFKADIFQSKSNVILASAADVSRLGLHEEWLDHADIKVFLVELGPGMELVVQNLDGTPILTSTNSNAAIPNRADDTGVLLFTSGTAGATKLVPLSVHSMVCGVAMVIESWGLTPSMRCLNQMPLNHVGGLIRNLFAPVMSGGSVICCSAFDANLFWDSVEDHAPTWYYASPTMHQCILEAAAERPDGVVKSQIRLVCNAAGGLLPSLARQLRSTFSIGEAECTVLPSYGMTECMPISTPPLDYRLERMGTSGISVGTDLNIRDDCDELLEADVVGRICVRGPPVFDGYLTENNVVDKSCFSRNGWFDTGDLGYLDSDGYLYITGRSKEVINRGGELISPFEVEEAIVAASAGQISKALAFSVPHDVLQEVVGMAVVTSDGCTRLALRQIQTLLKSTLSLPKTPVLVVYMDGGLPTNNNKVLRIKLADRLGLPELSNDISEARRHYEAVCPPTNTPLSQKIECKILSESHSCLETACKRTVPDGVDVHVRTDASGFYPELLLAPRSSLSRHLFSDYTFPERLINQLSRSLHGYHLPSKVRQLEQSFPRNPDGNINKIALAERLISHTSCDVPIELSPTESIVAALFSQMLNVSRSELSSTSDFFDLGGDSMKAGRLLSGLRKTFQLRLPIDALFANRQISTMASLIDERSTFKTQDHEATSGGSIVQTKFLPGCEETYSSTRPFLLLVHLLPLCLFYPMKRALTWTVFMYCLSFGQRLPTNGTIPGRLLNLVASMAIGRTVTTTVVPMLAITFKWLVIGRFKEGLYPMWGSYHTQWWLCQRTIAVAGMGIWGTFNWSRVLYYRLLGAKIGKHVTLNKGATLGEYDLLTIEDGVVLERCTVRPFAAERNTSMYLGKITLRVDSTVGLGSIVAAGASVPPNTCIGPNSSSWEADEAEEGNRSLASSTIPGTHWLLNIALGLPLQALITFVGVLPWLGCLVALVNHQPKGSLTDELRKMIIWFASPERVGFHYAALAANAALGPVFFFVSFFVVKKIFDMLCGKIRPSHATSRSQMTKFRMQFLRTLMPAPRLHKLTELFGTHYEATSIFARALGAKVGKRVYWPGTGPSWQDPDLIDIGDDVVFGSRSHLVTSDGSGSDYVKIGDDAMVADRVVLLPGVELGTKTVMGSGALTKRNAHYAAASTWVGSKKNEAICLTTSFCHDDNRSGSGHCTSQFYDTVKLPPPIERNFSSYNSSRTTLTKDHDSGTSGSSTLECGRPATQDVIGFSQNGNDKLPTSIVVREVSEKASAVADVESSSPFGRAFYQGLAPYRVWTQFEIFLYSTTITIVTAIYWNIGSISAVQVVAHTFKHGSLISTVFLAPTWSRPLALYISFLALLIVIMAAQTIAVLLFLIAAKWVLMGHRQPGNYSWDKSPYCQRWQLYLKLESLRRHCYGGHGILGMLTGTHWIVLYFRALGSKIGQDCALFAGGLPSLMFTEPDLLTLGDRVSVDDASLVAHINTRGKFDLNPLHVGDRSVLRSGSRLLSGARMEADTCLLEHTLVVAGDVVEQGCTNQGWPAEEFKGSRMPTLKAKQVWASV